MAEITVEVRLRWWLMPYLHALVFFCDLFNREPDWQKLDRVIARGLKVVHK